MKKQQDKKAASYFRDSLSTVDSMGKRVWVYAKKPKGPLFNRRRILAIILLILLFSGPFLTLKGEPFMLFNILERKFIIFGVIFWPQDFHLILLAFITILVFVVLFTVVFGRLFCGWVCPQTIFMEFIFRRIEYWIEGDAAAQRRLNKQAMDFNKFWKKALKHVIFFSIAFVTANIFLAYIVGIEEVKSYIINGPLEHLSGFIAIVLFSGAFYFVFAFFREQVCTIACPYGRLQGVMIDKKTIQVSYDYLRGEPRNAKKDVADAGDCVACNSCVTVCPTGIDIRNGSQMECINCTACIDACNTVMKRVKKPTGLIRYDSEDGIKTGKNSIFNPRSIAYSAVLGLLLIFVASLFAFRGDYEVTILRARGSLYQEYGKDSISNIFNYNIVNKVRTPVTVDFHLESHPGRIQHLGEPLVVERGKVGKGSILVIIAKETLEQSKTPIIIGLYNDGTLTQSYKSSFVGPNEMDY